MADSRQIIRASEIGEYEFCARAWWHHQVLGWQTLYPERLRRGERAHAAHGRQVYASSRLVQGGVLLLMLALLVWAVL